MGEGQSSRWLWLVWVGSLLLRAGYAAWLYPHWLPGDAADYWAEAGRWLSDATPGIYWPPGLPLWLALWRAALGEAPWVSVLATLVLWSGLFGQMAWLSRGVAWRWRLAWLGWLSGYPALVHQSVVPLSHLPVACCLLAIVGGSRSPLTLLRGLGLGLIFGVAALFRPGCLVLVPVWLGYLFWSHRHQISLRSAAIALALLLGVAIPILSWRAHSPALRAYAALVNTATPYNIFIGNQPETPSYRSWWLGSHVERAEPAFAPYYARLDSIRALPDSQQGKGFLRAAWSHVREAPGQFLRRMWNRAKVFWAFDTLAGATLSRRQPLAGRLLIMIDALAYGLLMALVLTRLAAGKLRRRRWLLLLLAYPLPYWLAFSHPTYHLPLLPLLGWWVLAQQPWAWPQGKARAWAAALLLAWLAIQVEWAWSWLG